jgi:hypothetical protein
MHKPFGGEVRRGAYCQNPGVLPLLQTLSADCDSVKSIAHDSKIFAAGLSDHQSLTLAIEELDAERLLQRLNLMAHGSLCDT